MLQYSPSSGTSLVDVWRRVQHRVGMMRRAPTADPLGNMTRAERRNRFFGRPPKGNRKSEEGQSYRAKIG